MTNSITKTSFTSAQMAGFHTRRAVSVLAGISLAALVAACNTAPPPKPEGKQLSATEVQALFMSGKPTVSQGISVKSGREWKISRDGSGVPSLAMVSSDYTDTGTYRVDGTMVCSKWVKTRNGVEACNSVFATPDGKYQSADEKGKKTNDFTVVDGS